MSEMFTIHPGERTQIVNASEDVPATLSTVGGEVAIAFSPDRLPEGVTTLKPGGTIRIVDRAWIQAKDEPARVNVER